MSKSRRYINDNEADKQLKDDLQVIEQIAKRWEDNERVKEVMRQNFDSKRGRKWTL